MLVLIYLCIGGIYTLTTMPYQTLANTLSEVVIDKYYFSVCTSKFILNIWILNWYSNIQESNKIYVAIPILSAMFRMKMLFSFNKHAWFMQKIVGIINDKKIPNLTKIFLIFQIHLVAVPFSKWWNKQCEHLPIMLGNFVKPEYL